MLSWCFPSHDADATCLSNPAGTDWRRVHGFYGCIHGPAGTHGLMGFYSGLMGFYSGLMGFYSGLMGFDGD